MAKLQDNYDMHKYRKIIHIPKNFSVSSELDNYDYFCKV